MNRLETKIILLCKNEFKWARDIWLDIKARCQDCGYSYDWIKKRCLELHYEGMLERRERVCGNSRNKGKRSYYKATEKGICEAQKFIENLKKTSSSSDDFNNGLGIFIARDNTTHKREKKKI